MLHYLIGKLIEKNLDNKYLILELNRIAYVIFSNLKTLNRLSINSEVKVYVKQVIKEDEIKLYGFMDKASKEIYELLVSVSGVGPKAAMNILDVLSPDEIVAAVIKDKAKLISSAPGVGLKTAQKLIIELKNKLSKFNSQSHHEEIHSDYKCMDEVSNILNNLGFNNIEVDKALSLAQEQGIADDSELLVRFCIKKMSEV
jgi:Holliday junction DNA helicase RuvA